jgi:hypothetical protein
MSKMDFPFTLTDNNNQHWDIDLGDGPALTMAAVIPNL